MIAFIKKHVKRLLKIGNPADDHKRSSHWPAVEHLHKKREPNCQWCGGTEHVQVHHRLPFHIHPELELDDGKDGTGTDGNLISLCMAPGKECHFQHGHNGTNWHDFNPNIRKECEARRKKAHA